MEPILVNTVSDKIADKENCRKMSGIYYIKGDVNIEDSGECYLINDKYYKYNTGYIIYDHSVKKYILKKEFNNSFNTEEGVVGFDEEDNPIFGAFVIKNKEDIVQVCINRKTFICLNESIVKNSKLYLESLQDGIYYNRKYLETYKFIVPSPCSREYKNSLPYDSRGITKKVKKKHLELYEPNYHPILENSKADITKGLSFGLEFETVNGNVPSRICNKLGLIPLRDGSIGGLEYVTVPLEGKKGFQAVIDTVKELKKRTTYDKNCSLHLHVGNIPRTEEFFIAIYKMLFLLQNDMYAMFPFHKKENYGVKRKHYTKPLPLETMLLFDNKIKTKKDIKNNFSILYNFLSMGQGYKAAGESIDMIESHPSDPRGNSKWNIRTRYHYVNLIPLLFGNKQTIEFRVHTPTYDCNKVINYMLTCFSIIDYTIRHQNEILKDFSNYVNINLNDVVFDSYYKDFSDNNLVQELQYYFEARRNHFFSKTQKGDFIADEDEFNWKSRYINWNSQDGKSIRTTLKKRNPYKSISDNLYREIERQIAEEPIINAIPPGVIVNDNIPPEPLWFDNNNPNLEE